MKIKTKFFDEIEVDKDEIVDFEYGLPGFEDERKFIIIDVQGKTSLKCLQSINTTNVCLLIISPWEYFKDYEVDLSDEEINNLGITSSEEVQIFNVITVRESLITANLVAPVIINSFKNKGKQIILSNTKYDIRQEITCLY